MSRNESRHRPRFALSLLLSLLVLATATPAVAQQDSRDRDEEAHVPRYRDPLFTERDSVVRQLGLRIENDQEKTGKLCKGWPVKACRFDVVFDSYTNVESPFGDKKAEYGFIIAAGGFSKVFPGSTYTEQGSGFYAELGEGSSRNVGKVVDTHVVGCGESKRIPLLVFAEEEDWLFANDSEYGQTTSELLLECKPGVMPKWLTVPVELVNNFGNVKHKVDVTLRAEVSNEDHCGPVSIHETDISGGECEIEVRYERVTHDERSKGNQRGLFYFDVSAGGETHHIPHISETMGQVYYFIEQGFTETIDKQIAVHRLGCGERRKVPIHLKGVEHDAFYDDSGETTGYIELSCPMKKTSVFVDLTLYGNGSGNPRHYLKALFSARDLGWSEFNAEGVNQCCQKAKCNSECPVIGTFDGANCLVAEAPPPPAQPFRLNPSGFLHQLYYTPVNGQCSVGTWDTANCHVASVPTELATPFIWQRNHYVGACKGACTRACPDIGTFDGANCLVGSAPEGSQAFIWNGAFYHTQVNGQCTYGTFDGANCWVASIPQSTTPFIYQNRFYVEACKP